MMYRRRFFKEGSTILSFFDYVDEKGISIDSRFGVISLFLFCIYAPLWGLEPLIPYYNEFANSIPLPVLVGLQCFLPLVGAILGLTSLIRRIIHAESKLGALDEIIGFRWGFCSTFGTLFGILIICFKIWIAVFFSDK